MPRLQQDETTLKTVWARQVFQHVAELPSGKAPQKAQQAATDRTTRTAAFQ
jgi:hypothetical protein